MFETRPWTAARKRFAALLIAGPALVLGPAASAEAITVTDLDSGTSATQLAQSLAGPGVTISNVTYTGANRAAGSFTGGAGSIGFESGTVLDSGKVQTYATDPPCSVGVEGPNSCNEDLGTENTTSLGTPGDSALDALVAPNTTQDATVLEFDLVPQQGAVDFSYVFSSDEYNDFANTSFNDVFAFFVNGTNCALVPGTTDPVSVNTINNGNPTGDPTPHNPQLFRDNVRPAPTIDSQMDGLTTVLTCNATVNAGQTNHIKLAIADVTDSAFDSAVFIQAGSIVSPAPPVQAQPPAQVTPPAAQVTPPAAPPAAQGPPCQGRPATIVGTPGPETLTGTNGPDVIQALGGKDVVVGQSGNDLLCGSNGKDQIKGGKGNDTLVGGAAADLLLGGAGDDRLFGGTPGAPPQKSKDTCRGQGGADTRKNCESGSG
jgi:Ca2+-binding RTX toxin-like protein